MTCFHILFGFLLTHSWRKQFKYDFQDRDTVVLDQRQEILTKKFEAGDVGEILKSYDEKEVDFSDHGNIPLSTELLRHVLRTNLISAWGVANIDRNGLIAFFQETYTTVPGLKMITHGVHGTKEFSVWEWALKFKATENDKARGLEKGKDMWLRGCICIGGA